MPNQIWDRVLCEVERNSFIALPGKGGHSGLMPLKMVCPHPLGFDEFHNKGSRVGLVIRLGCVQGLHSFGLASGGLLMSFSDSQGYHTTTFSLEWGLLHLPFIKVFSSIESSKDVMCITWGEPGLCPKVALLFLGGSSLSLHLLPSLISNCSNLPFRTQGRSRRLESVPYKQETGDRKASVPRNPRRSCSILIAVYK